MKSIIKKIILILLIFSFMNLKAEGGKQIIFEVIPSDLIMLIDGKKTEMNELRIVDMTPGIHDVTLILKDKDKGAVKFSIFGEKLFHSTGANIIAKGKIDTTRREHFKITMSSVSNKQNLSAKIGRRELDNQSTLNFELPLPKGFVESYKIPCNTLDIKYERTSLNRGLLGGVKSTTYDVYSRCGDDDFKKMSWNKPYYNSFSTFHSTKSGKRMGVRLGDDWNKVNVEIIIY